MSNETVAEEVKEVGVEEDHIAEEVRPRGAQARQQRLRCRANFRALLLGRRAELRAVEPPPEPRRVRRRVLRAARGQRREVGVLRMRRVPPTGGDVEAQDELVRALRQDVPRRPADVARQRALGRHAAARGHAPAP